MRERREDLRYKYMEKMKSIETILYLNCYLGQLQVLVITSSEKTPRNSFYLMAQLLVGPKEQIHFLHFSYFRQTLTSNIIINNHICKYLGKFVVFFIVYFVKLCN